MYNNEIKKIPSFATRVKFFFILGMHLKKWFGTHLPPCIKKLYMYMLASLNMMTLNSTLNFIYTSESCNTGKCCVIYQSLSYVTHYMTKSKTPKMDLNTDRSYSVWGHSNVLSESALLSWAYSWLVRYYLYEL